MLQVYVNPTAYLIYLAKYTGEAVYVDDIPSPVNCLYGAFIYSTKPLARIKDITFRTKSLPDGVFALISSKDIPEGGANIGAGAFSYTEPLFADGLAECFGHRVALVVISMTLYSCLATHFHDDCNGVRTVLIMELLFSGCRYTETCK